MRLGDVRASSLVIARGEALALRVAQQPILAEALPGAERRLRSVGRRAAHLALEHHVHRRGNPRSRDCRPGAVRRRAAPQRVEQQLLALGGHQPKRLHDVQHVRAQLSRAVHARAHDAFERLAVDGQRARRHGLHLSVFGNHSSRRRVRVRQRNLAKQRPSADDVPGGEHTVAVEVTPAVQRSLEHHVQVRDGLSHLERHLARGPLHLAHLAQNLILRRREHQRRVRGKASERGVHSLALRLAHHDGRSTVQIHPRGPLTQLELAHHPLENLAAVRARHALHLDVRTVLRNQRRSVPREEVHRRVHPVPRRRIRRRVRVRVRALVGVFHLSLLGRVEALLGAPLSSRSEVTPRGERLSHLLQNFVPDLAPGLEVAHGEEVARETVVGGVDVRVDDARAVTIEAVHDVGEQTHSVRNLHRDLRGVRRASRVLEFQTVPAGGSRVGSTAYGTILRADRLRRQRRSELHLIRVAGVLGALRLAHLGHRQSRERRRRRGHERVGNREAGVRLGGRGGVVGVVARGSTGFDGARDGGRERRGCAEDDVPNVLGELSRLGDLGAVVLLQEEDVGGHVVHGGGCDVRLDDAVLVPLEEGGDVQEESRAVVRPQLDDGTRGVELVGHLHARGGKGEHPAPGDARAEVIVRQVRLAADPRHRGRHRVGRVSRRRLGLSVEILRAQHPNAHSAEVRGDAARPLHARVLSLRAASPRS